MVIGLGIKLLKYTRIFRDHKGMISILLKVQMVLFLFKRYGDVVLK